VHEFKEAKAISQCMQDSMRLDEKEDKGMDAKHYFSTIASIVLSSFSSRRM